MTADQDARVLELAREAIQEIAPEELLVFDTVGEALLRQAPRRGRRRRDGPLGFGLPEVTTLITPVALFVAQAVVARLAEHAGDSLLMTCRRRFRRLWRRPRPGRQRLDGGSNAALVELSPELRASLHALARGKARELGLEEAKAQRLVEALLRALPGGE
ncbi:hypothetical protein [Streptomyces sp. NPDC053048]|uniref:hypothetical protein n=1 Tax=Streptomyces sp. NPDC053048 TaxID=3365694 RepID=UPI0037D3FFE2